MGLFKTLMCRIPFKRSFLLLVAAFYGSVLGAQSSVVQDWETALLKTMQEDLARPHVQARNLFHLSIALYDAWAAYDKEANTYLLGKTVNDFTCPCNPIPPPADVEAARREAMSFAAYRLLTARYNRSPMATDALTRFREVMQRNGYNFQTYSSDYSSGSPAALGNYLAQCILQMGARDNAGEENNYQDARYKPLNPYLEVRAPGPGKINNPNHWQPLKLNSAIDLDGYPEIECNCLGRTYASLIDSADDKGKVRFTGTQRCQGADWSRAKPFALPQQNRRVYRRDGHDYLLYFDPGNAYLPRLDTLKNSGTSEAYKWNYALVAAWSGFMTPNDTTRWDVSPGSMGNVPSYPGNLAELPGFYQLETGRDAGKGWPNNPKTGEPYTPQWVRRGDYMRAVVQYWAEGPKEETAPGAWLSLLQYMSRQTTLVKKFNGKGQVMNELEWDVKSCFLLGSALHDAAIAAWGIKGWYESARPITALRYMAARGQSSDPALPSYHPAGIPLLPGRIELVKKGDPLAGEKNIHAGKIKIYAWKGPVGHKEAATETAGTGWILAENWVPFQPGTFVTPPYPGFVSGHAVFAHAAAEVFGRLTGDAFFPGGMGEFLVPADKQFLRMEQGPSTDIRLQWATYRDAADQAALSRVWAGTNAPFDDIPGRIIGAEVGKSAFDLAKTYFYKDRDRDGYLSFEDCDDNNAAIHPGATESCDGKDNDCNGAVDDVTPPCKGR